MALAQYVLCLCTCGVYPLGWNAIKSRIKFSNWNLQSQIFFGVLITLFLVQAILVSVLYVSHKSKWVVKCATIFQFKLRSAERPTALTKRHKPDLKAQWLCRPNSFSIWVLILDPAQEQRNAGINHQPDLLWRVPNRPFKSQNLLLPWFIVTELNYLQLLSKNIAFRNKNTCLEDDYF